MFKLKKCDISFLRDAPFRFVNSAKFKAESDAVFEVVSNEEHEKHWFPDYAEAYWTTPAPHSVGSTRVYKLSYMTLVEEFIVWERPEQWAFWVSECSLPLVRRFMEHYRISKTPEGSELEWQVCYEPNPWLRPLHPLLRPFFDRDFRKATANLCKYIEAGFPGKKAENS